MIRWKWMSLLALLASGCSGMVLGMSEPIKRSEYNRMPKMFEYDQYDDCLFSDPEEVQATFCLVRVVIKPDNGSELWRLIESFSSNRKLHFNHALLDRGICIGDVEEMKKRIGGENASDLVVPKFEIDFPVSYRVILPCGRYENKSIIRNSVTFLSNGCVPQDYKLKAA